MVRYSTKSLKIVITWEQIWNVPFTSEKETLCQADNMLKISLGKYPTHWIECATFRTILRMTCISQWLKDATWRTLLVFSLDLLSRKEILCSSTFSYVFRSLPHTWIPSLDLNVFCLLDIPPWVSLRCSNEYKLIRLTLCARARAHTHTPPCFTATLCVFPNLVKHNATYMLIKIGMWKPSQNHYLTHTYWNTEISISEYFCLKEFHKAWVLSLHPDVRCDAVRTPEHHTHSTHTLPVTVSTLCGSPERTSVAMFSLICSPNHPARSVLHGSMSSRAAEHRARVPTLIKHIYIMTSAHAMHMQNRNPHGTNQSLSLSAVQAIFYSISLNAVG